MNVKRRKLLKWLGIGAGMAAVPVTTVLATPGRSKDGLISRLLKKRAQG